MGDEERERIGERKLLVLTGTPIQNARCWLYTWLDHKHIIADHMYISTDHMHTM